MAGPVVKKLRKTARVSPAARWEDSIRFACTLVGMVVEGRRQEKSRPLPRYFLPLHSKVRHENKPLVM